MHAVQAGPPVEKLALLDAILAAHRDEIGVDLVPYRNHTYRVANLSIALSGAVGDAIDRIAIAAAFHDLGIWTDHTFDYLEPSVHQAETWLVRSERGAWSAEIAAMIRNHHKVTAYVEPGGMLVEAFRRADWIDVTSGVLRFGIARDYIRSLYARWPDAGFHRLLVRLELHHLRAHPLNPLPVFRL